MGLNWKEVMASVVGEGALVYQVEEEESSSSTNITDAVIFVGISLVLGIASRHLLRGTRVPYTVALLVCGIGLGSLGIIIISHPISLIFCLLC